MGTLERPLRGVHVLLVEDDEDARVVLRTILDYCGANVLTATSAREALRVIGTVVPDVIVTDVMMPDEDGIWLLGQVQALPEGQGVLTIALTAEADLPEVARAQFQAVLRKPVEPEVLCRTIRSLLDRARPGP